MNAHSPFPVRWHNRCLPLSDVGRHGEGGNGVGVATGVVSDDANKGDGIVPCVGDVTVGAFVGDGCAGELMDFEGVPASGVGTLVGEGVTASGVCALVGEGVPASGVGALVGEGVTARGVGALVGEGDPVIGVAALVGEKGVPARGVVALVGVGTAAVGDGAVKGDGTLVGNEEGVLASSSSSSSWHVQLQWQSQ